MKTVRLHGHEYPLEMTVQAFADISDLCPGKDIQRMQEIASMPTGESMILTAKILAAMSSAAENKLHFEDSAYIPNPITVEAVTVLPVTEYTEVMKMVFETLGECMSDQTVELEAPKKNSETDEK